MPAEKSSVKNKVNIPYQHIKEAESYLLGIGKSFEVEERVPFIKNLETCDLLAVPGSGKTTALMAKLYCLEKHLPFENGSGILVLSHTNAAIEEIKKKLQPICPKLFQYPNFVGTVQSFVNKYLAIPYYVQKIGSKPLRIEADSYNAAIKKKMEFYKRGKIYHIILKNPQIFYSARFFSDLTGKVTLVKNMEGEPLAFKMPKNWNEADKKEILNTITKLKIDLIKEGILHFDDCYFLADKFLKKYSNIKKLLQNRFSYVFVDEMQDLDFHQVKIIDNIFLKEECPTVIQRIGDKNQAIYSTGKTVKAGCEWKTRGESEPEKYTDLKITGSNRLTNENAELVDYFILDRVPLDYKVVGLRNLNKPIPPHLLVFKWENRLELIDNFKQIIKEYQRDGIIPQYPDHPFKVIAWSAVWDDTEKKEDDKNRIRLQDICYYSKEVKNKREDFDSLSKYLQLYDKEAKTLQAVQNSILNALVYILDLEEEKYEAVSRGKKTTRKYTRSKLIEYIKEYNRDNNSVYNSFKQKLYDWCFDIICGKEEKAYDSLKNFIETEFKTWFNLNLNSETSSFVGNQFVEELLKKEINTKHQDDLDIEVGTVHSAKGQTHCATLYVETFYHKYETEKVKKPFYKQKHNFILGEKAGKREKDSRKKEALKMMYVGFSRPTHLLCFAALYDNVKNDIDKFENAGWKVIQI